MWIKLIIFPNASLGGLCGISGASHMQPVVSKIKPLVSGRHQHQTDCQNLCQSHWYDHKSLNPRAESIGLKVRSFFSLGFETTTNIDPNRLKNYTSTPGDRYEVSISLPCKFPLWDLDLFPLLFLAVWFAPLLAKFLLSRAPAAVGSHEFHIGGFHWEKALTCFPAAAASSPSRVRATHARQGPHLSINIGIGSDTVFILTIQIERRQCYLTHTTRGSSPQQWSSFLQAKLWTERGEIPPSLTLDRKRRNCSKLNIGKKKETFKTLKSLRPSCIIESFQLVAFDSTLEPICS